MQEDIVVLLTELGKQISDWRRRKKVSQDTLCEAAGISRTTLSQLERGMLSELGYTKVNRLLCCLDKQLMVGEEEAYPHVHQRFAERVEETDDLPTSTPGPGL